MKQLTKQRIEDTFNKIEDNPSLMSIPFSVLEEFKNNNHLHPKYIKLWEETLKLPLSEIKKLILADNEHGEILRTTSVFIRIP